MKRISPLVCHKTSISLPASSYRKMLAAQKVLGRNRVYLSEQEIYRRLLKLYLKNWRGHGRKTNRLRRYNVEGKEYGIHPLYVNQVLHAALWKRALHSGESISRILDFAIRTYLSRLMEHMLCRPVFCSVRSERNFTYWAARLGKRTRKYSDFFINYTCKTVTNDTGNLHYVQATQIISKSGLSPWQILDLIQRAA